MKLRDARFDDAAIKHAHGVVPAGQAGHEGLVALQALGVQALQLDERLCVVVDT